MEIFGLIIFSILAIAVGVGILFLSAILGPKRSLPEKLGTYECGVEVLTPSTERFNVHFYMIAIVFMLFDIEAIFLIPWAVNFKLLGATALVEIVIFMAVLVLGWVYVIRRGVLDWD